MPLPYSKDSPKKHHHRAFPSPSSTSPRLSLPLPLLLFAVFSLAVGAIGIALAASALRRPPRTVAVFRCGKDEDRFRTFQAGRDSGGGGDGGSGGGVAKPKVLGVVGVLTGFGGAERRAALRNTWFPPDPESLTNLEHATGLVFRFVIGRLKDANKMGEFKKEEEKYHDFIFIDVEEDYVQLPYKTLAFLKAALNLFEAEFYVKMDDNVYLRPDRLATLLAKERSHPLTYIGCMKNGPVVTDPKKKWYESKSSLVGSEYFLHAYGPIYSLSLEVVSTIAAAKNSSLRLFGNEDVTIGAWMLGMNVNHEDIEALCQTQCTPTSIAVWDMPKCSGLCNPVKKLEELHSIPMCSISPTISPEEVDD